MSLERGYRRLMLAYPRWWWDARGEEVLAVLLDGAEARGAHRPSAAEMVDLIGHGLLARVGRFGATVGAEFDGRARELAAALAMASLTAMSLVCLLFGEWWPWTAVGDGRTESLSSYAGTPGPFWTLGGPLMILLLLAGMLVLLGAPRVGRVLLGGLVPVIVATPVAASVLGLKRPALWVLVGLLMFALLALLAPVRRRRLLGGLMIGLSGAICYTVYSHLDPGFDPREGFYYGVLFQSLAIAVPLGVLAAVVIAGTRRAVVPTCLVGSAWLLALAGGMVSTMAETTGAWIYLAGTAGLVLVALETGRYRRLMDAREPARP